MTVLLETYPLNSFPLFCYRKVCYGQGLRSLRTLFPRPYCIHSEGALDKAVYLLQPAMQGTDGSPEELVSEMVGLSSLSAPLLTSGLKSLPRLIVV